MTIATGVTKSVIIKEETTWGTLAGSSGGQVMRRLTSDFNLSKDSYKSNEIRTDRQTVDMRHGMRKVDGTINQELAPGSASKMIAAILCKDFAVGATATSLSLTITTSGSTYVLTRATGSFITDSFKVGSVLRLSVGTLNAANINKNLMIVGVTALALTVVTLNGSTMVNEGPVANVTASTPGKQTFIPQTAQTDRSFTVEQFFSNISQSEVYTGCKVASVALNLPSTGLATCNTTLQGKDLALTGTSQYFTAPTAQTTTGALSAVNGVLWVNGEQAAVLTGLTINIAKTLTPAGVIGSNVSADVFSGQLSVSGNAAVWFIDDIYRNIFVNETEVAISFAITTGNTAAADFIAVSLPRCKFKTATTSDSADGISGSHDFDALLNVAGGTGMTTELTTIVVQDSAA